MVFKWNKEIILDNNIIQDKKNIFDLKFSKSRSPVAWEMFSSGWCNLDCKYCYIPKDDFLKDIHRNIIKQIKSGEYLKWGYETFGPELECISHWGTEPTLTLNIFKDFYKEAFKIFPKLKAISFSSNFMMKPDNLLNFIKNLSSALYDIDKNRQISLDVQMSLDGPPWITDKNRRLGGADLILSNILSYVERANKELDLDKTKNVLLTSHFKPTIGADDINVLKDYNKTKEYYDYFENIFEKIKKVNTNNKIDIGNNINPTLVVPFQYTTQDGKNYNQFYNNVLKLAKNIKYIFFNPVNTYELKYIQQSSYPKNEFFINQTNHTCSAGDTSISIDDNRYVQPCHRTYYIDNKDYHDALLKSCDRDVKDNKSFDMGIVDFVRDNFKVKVDDRKEALRFIYVSRGYHDFFKQKVTGLVSYILECADTKQINKLYKDEIFAQQLALMCLNSCSCPVENVFNSGSQTIEIGYLVRLFGNGFFENMLIHFYGDKLIDA